MANTKLTAKQQRFVEEYLIDLNATKAAIRAGYSEKTANEQGSQLLVNLSIKKYIEEHLSKMKKDSIASAEEVLEYLTSVVRGTETEEVLSSDGLINKKVTPKDRLKAAELLGKRYSLYTEVVDASVKVNKKLDDVFKQVGGKGLDESDEN